MKSIKRREFFGLGSTALAAGLLSPGFYVNMPGKTGKKITPVIHCTDLYHVCQDPDDHYDLATVYALASSGLVYILGILIDFPIDNIKGDPDIMAVSQMNYCTGFSVPSVVGTPLKMKNRNDTLIHADKSDIYGILWLIDTLRKSPDQVIITITGASTNVAAALKKEPELFRKKCKAIFLSAGKAFRGPDEGPDTNVEMNPSAYAAIFDSPCPLYWVPCLQGMNKRVGEYASQFTFRQSEILPFLSAKIQNFFLFMFNYKEDTKWLKYILKEPSKEMVDLQGTKNRNMWSTAGLFHSAGLKVTEDGELVDMQSDKKQVFSFKPVNITCNDNGLTSWELSDKSRDRFIFHIDDLSKYQEAMTTSLKNILLKLP